MDTRYPTFPSRTQTGRLSRSQTNILFIISVGLSIAIVANVFILAVPTNRLAWGMKIHNTNVGFQTQDEAVKRLKPGLNTPESFTLTVTNEGEPWVVSSSELGHDWEFSQTFEQALKRSHPENPWENLKQRWMILLGRENVALLSKLNPESVNTWVTARAQEIDVPGRPPSANFKNGVITFDEGQAGRVLVQELLREELLKHQQSSTVAAEFEPDYTPLSPDGRTAAQQRLEKLTKLSFQLHGESTDLVQSIPASEFFPWLALPYGFNETKLENGVSKIATTYVRAPQDASWKLDATGKKLTEFAPHREGRALNTIHLKKELARITTAVEQGSETPSVIQLEFQKTEPTHTLEKTNTLGVKERIGVGTSSYGHSIPNRIHNVGLTSERVHATLVLPGEEFSFNEAVGEITQRTGYKTAYVIKDGMTQLGDGGGVCQVSTTIFRAALNAGLPITRWKAHSYRVSYYEQNAQPGFDATVYSPSTDFRFKNDTPGAIVITSQADAENQHMVVEIWGSSDGRKSEISNYSLSNQRPPPETQFVEDPTLPRGTRRQIDWSAPGATTRFTYTVTNADGSEKMHRDFVSTFRPWRAVYLVGTRD